MCVSFVGPTHQFYFMSVLHRSQQKLKEEKEAKRASLDARHQYVFGMLAMRLNMEESEVEEHMLDGDQVCLHCSFTCLL